MVSDWIELWLRRSGKPWLTGVVLIGFAAVRDWVLPLKVLALAAGVVMLGHGTAETWRLIRDRKQATAMLDRLEAEERGMRRG